MKIELEFITFLPPFYMRNGHFYPDVKCMVQGVGGDKVYLKLKDGRLRSCKVEDIRNVQFMDPLEWYEKK